MAAEGARRPALGDLFAERSKHPRPVFTIEATATSLAASECQFATLDGFARMLRDGRRIYPQAAELPDATERALVGGIASILFAHLLAEDAGVLETPEPELVELLLLPFLGPSQALLSGASAIRVSSGASSGCRKA